jgi:chromosome segregation ATPase
MSETKPRNPWHERAMKAESQIAALKAEVERLREQIEPNVLALMRLNQKQRVENERLRAGVERLREAQRLVSKQAEDEGLWFYVQTAPEAYLQAELRKLHEAIEGEGASGDACARRFLAALRDDDDKGKYDEN